MDGRDGFGDRGWLEAWLEAFHAGGRHCWLDVPGARGPALLVVDHVKVLRARCLFLRSPTRFHCPRWGLRLPAAPATAAAVDDVSRALRAAIREQRVHGIDLGLIAEGSPTHQVVQALAATGAWVVHVRPAETTALVDTSGDWEAYYASRAKKLRQNMASRERKLRERGELWLGDLAGGDDWVLWLRRVLELEAAGWKGREGSAILQHPEQAKFYERVAGAARTDGRLRIVGVLLDGRMIAGRIDVLEDGAEYFLKTTYGEAFAQLAPGHFVRRQAIQACFADPRVHWADFLGPLAPEKAEWATHQEPLVAARLAPAWSPGGLLLRAELALRRIQARRAPTEAPAADAAEKPAEAAR